MIHRIVPPVIVLICLILGKALFPESYKLFAAFGLCFWLLYWWISGAVSLGITSLIPLFYVPLTGIADFSEISQRYANPVIFLFLGGFLLALALEKHELHQWLARKMLYLTGNSPRSKILGILFTSAAMSMWISNTATALIMLPIAIQYAKEQESIGKRALLSVAFGANIGGIATLVGTPPNLFLAAYVREQYNYKIDFITWMSIGLPVALLLLIAVGVILLQGIANETPSNSKVESPPVLSANQKKVGGVFLGVALLWIFKPIIEPLLGGVSIDDAAIAIGGVVILAIIPNSTNNKALVDHQIIKDVPWDIILLFGGGMSLAFTMQNSGMIDLLLGGLPTTNYHTIVWIAIAAAIGIFATEILSNIALVAVILPYLEHIATKTSLHFMILAVPLIIGASCAFMLPIATPPNAIVFASGKLTVSDMIKVGWKINTIAFIIITLSAYFLIELLGVLVF